MPPNQPPERRPRRIVRIDRVTTRGGDGGETSLGDGARVGKDSPRIIAIGAVDEANAALGMLRLHTREHAEIDGVLARIQHDLFDLGADLCVPGNDPARMRLHEAPLLRLDADIAHWNAALPSLASFVLPGGSPGAAQAHMARTIARRAERDVVHLAGLEPLNPLLVRYLNRLSDLLFVLARVLNDNGAADVLWRPAAAEPGGTEKN